MTVTRIWCSETGSSAAPHLRRSLLVAAWAALAIFLAGAVPARAQASQSLLQVLPSPANPSFEPQALTLQAQDVEAVRHWRDSLAILDQVIRARESGVPSNDDRDLDRWKGQAEMKLLQAEAALAQLEQDIRHDFNGRLPAWWPQRQA